MPGFNKSIIIITSRDMLNKENLIDKGDYIVCSNYNKAGSIVT